MGYKIRVQLKKVDMAKEINLPEPKEKGSTSIEETLNTRRSVRDYRKSPLRLEQISQLLWAASGKNLYLSLDSTDS
jgi:phage anti-repressor protein